jgi:hypothetical protein
MKIFKFIKLNVSIRQLFVAQKINFFTMNAFSIKVNYRTKFFMVKKFLWHSTFEKPFISLLRVATRYKPVFICQTCVFASFEPEPAGIVSLVADLTPIRPDIEDPERLKWLESGKQPEVTPEAGKQPEVTPEAGKQPEVTPEAGKQSEVTSEAGKQPEETPDARKQPEETPDARKQPEETPDARKQPEETPDARKQPEVMSEVGKEQRAQPILVNVLGEGLSPEEKARLEFEAWRDAKSKVSNETVKILPMGNRNS